MKTRLCRGCFAWFAPALRAAVLGFAALSAAGILLMLGVTCADIVMRLCGSALTGAYDLVQIGCAVTIACGLPYTTAVKGHVAIEFFFHKLPRRGRIAVDTLCRTLGIALFAALAHRGVVYGTSLKRAGQVTQTLQIPLFWLPWLLALTFAAVALVILHNLLHPGREMIKP